MGSCCLRSISPPPSKALRPPDAARIGTKHVDQVVTGTDAEGQAFVNEYTFVRQLGAGKFGSLNLCVHYQSRDPFAIREVARQVITRKDLFNAGLVLKNVRHPHIIQLFEIIDDPHNEHIYLVLEFVNGAEPIVLLDLSGHTKGPPLDETTCRRHFLAVVDALEYLHGSNVVHGNLQPSSILIEEGTQRVKVSGLDVGNLLQEEDDARQRLVGNPFFMAPEACQGRYFSGKIHDMWQLGVTLYVCLFGRVPFAAKGSELHVDIQTKEVSFSPSPTYPSVQLSKSLMDLISRLLHKNPIMRITIGEVHDHAWITDQEEDPTLEGSDPRDSERCSICGPTSCLLEQDPARKEELAKSMRVLIAVDVYLIGYITNTIVTSVLDCANLVVDQVAGGAEAVEACELHDYQLILMDVHLPRMNAFEAAKAIRATEAQKHRQWSCFIIGLTPDCNSARLRATAKESGLNDLLAKPMTPGGFRSSCVKHHIPTKSGVIKVRPIFGRDCSKRIQRRGHALISAYDKFLRQQGEAPSESGGSTRDADLFRDLPKPTAHSAALPAPHKTHFIEACNLVPFGIAHLIQRLLASDRCAPLWFLPDFYSSLHKAVAGIASSLPESPRPGRYDDRKFHSRLDSQVVLMHQALTDAFQRQTSDEPLLALTPALRVSVAAYPWPILDPSSPPVHSCGIFPYLRHLCLPPGGSSTGESPTGQTMERDEAALESTQAAQTPTSIKDDLCLMLLASHGETTATVAECLRCTRNLLPFQIVRSPAYPDNIPEALRDAFLETDRQTKEWLLAHDHHNSPGCSAFLAILRDTHLWMAQTGAIQAVAFTEEGIQVATMRHTPAETEEKRRVAEQGGTVQFRSGTWRVNGRFLTTRALGHSVCSAVIIPEPQILDFDLNTAGFKFLVIGSGLWAVMSLPDIGSLVSAGMQEFELSRAERAHLAPEQPPSLEAVIRRRASPLYAASRLRSLMQAQLDQAHGPSATTSLPRPRRHFRPLPEGCPSPPEPESFLLNVLGLGPTSGDGCLSSRWSSMSSTASSSGRIPAEPKELPPETSDYEDIIDRGIIAESLVVAAVRNGCGEDLSVIVLFFDSQPNGATDLGEPSITI